ncbi:NAD(P)-binding domain-containing protein [Brevibacterium sp. FME37]|uniref:NAD(P)-binding domain-containing protein n=1 Tax=Brevibacterium sp. FME37 TaxID=2742607 RepID=UPI0018683230|nr:NAD(P)-binding domain-containing protein [Brevibacterium sp. FME37]
MRVLLAGCGDLGTRLGLRLVDSGQEVIGLRRHPEELPDSFEKLYVDLGNPGTITIEGVDAVVITLTPDDYSDASYEQTYRRGVEGLISILGSRPKRVILVSSTRVLGAAAPGETTDEETVPKPESGPARTLWDTEELIRATYPSAAIVRAAGIYGREDSPLIKGVRSGRAVNYRRWTNRVHYRDLIRGMEALLFTPDPPQLLHAADSCPVQLGEVVGFLASALDISAPPDLEDEPEAGRRIKNTRFQDLLGSLEFPTFREGYSHELRSTK